MNQIPFLIQFKKKRSNDDRIKKMEYKYNENLDYNILNRYDNIEVKVMTQTRVRHEEADKMPNEFYDDNENYKLYYQTKTYTDTKSEEPDNIEDNIEKSEIEVLGTQTMTKIKNESADQDQ